MGLDLTNHIKFPEGLEDPVHLLRAVEEKYGEEGLDAVSHHFREKLVDSLTAIALHHTHENTASIREAIVDYLSPLEQLEQGRAIVVSCCTLEDTLDVHVKVAR